jgi:hypothetical protein
MTRPGTTIVSSLLVARAAGHAALYSPVPRNANDRDLPLFSGGKSPKCPCTCDNGMGTRGGPWPNNAPCGQGGNNVTSRPCNEPCDRGVRSKADGQSCLWWSQGCSIGCTECATVTGGTKPVTGTAPHTDKIGFRTRYCNSTFEPTLPRHAWTMNIHAVEGSEEDSYRYNPWRAPGFAPVVDACGQAGGKYYETPIGGESVYWNTTLSKFGDLGSQVLPKGLAMATWQAGAAVEVMWGMRYNHGGGYQYRLCPADQPLTEECFQKRPLAFDRTKQALLWLNGTRFEMGAKAVFVDEGTFPAGSTWARNPIPRTNTDNVGNADAASCPGPNSGKSGPGCTQFPPPCPQDKGPEDWSTDLSFQGQCSGDWTTGLIADTVLLPADLPPGDYVLGWRNDCEETAQIWSNCADVHITVAAAPMVEAA